MRSRENEGVGGAFKCSVNISFTVKIKGEQGNRDKRWKGGGGGGQGREEGKRRMGKDGRGKEESDHLN